MTQGSQLRHFSGVLAETQIDVTIPALQGVAPVWKSVKAIHPVNALNPPQIVTAANDLGHDVSVVSWGSIHDNDCSSSRLLFKINKKMSEQHQAPDHTAAWFPTAQQPVFSAE